MKSMRAPQEVNTEGVTRDSFHHPLPPPPIGNVWTRGEPSRGGEPYAERQCLRDGGVAYIHKDVERLNECLLASASPTNTEGKEVTGREGNGDKGAVRTTERGRGGEGRVGEGRGWSGGGEMGMGTGTSNRRGGWKGKMARGLEWGGERGGRFMENQEKR